MFKQIKVFVSDVKSRRLSGIYFSPPSDLLRLVGKLSPVQLVSVFISYVVKKKLLLETRLHNLLHSAEITSKFQK